MCLALHSKAMIMVALRCHVLSLLIVDKIHIFIGAILIKFVGVHPQRRGEGFVSNYTILIA